ncbi:hypermethylated in cancer 1 protein isoform X1 [Siphateles boraxobius]|uniref:hypermethylated in cancer 1 protein isoform X1 n=2 Tax=Siphateles boraxobius TaxID=180520 RepID=UPI0040638CAA
MIIKGDLDRMAEEIGHPGIGLKSMLDAMEVPSHARHLLLQLNTQRTKGFLCDVIIVVQNALFRAHKNILAASSLYLKSLVVHDNLINLDHEMVSPGVFRVILDYIYTGRLSEGDPTSPTEPNIGAVLAAASYLQLLDLVTLCKKKMKRNGKYHLRPNPGFLPYKIDPSGMGGRRFRISPPVIHSVVSTPRPIPLEDLPPLPRPPNGGEIYAPAHTQGPPPYPPAKASLSPQSGLRLAPTDRNCSSVYGLDLTKKSPQSQHPSGHPHLISSLHPEEEPEGELDQSTSPLLSPNDGSRKMEAAHHAGSLTPHPFPLPNHPLAPHLPHLHRPQGQEPYPCPPSPEPMEDSREQGRDGSSIYRWVKNEPSNPEDEDEEDEEDDSGGMGEQDKERHHQHMNHHKNSEEKLSELGYDRGTCDDAEDENGTGSEETGSSEGRPSPPVPGGRYHMPYEPESFGDNLYVCIPCDKGFPSSEQLNAHVETHNEEELNNGSELEHSSKPTNAHGPISLNTTSGLHSPFLDNKSAQNLHSIGLGEIIRPYRCSSCDKSYKDPATLRQHEKTHWLTRPYPCSICGKKFTQRGTMTRHMRSHLGLKPFACDACGMRFTRQYRLTEHMRIHSGEKPYECQVCGGKFAQQRNLISHMKMHSSGAAGGGLTPDGKLKMDFSEGIYPLSKYAAEHLGLKQEKTSDLFAASQHLLADPKVMESLYPLSKLAVEHLGLTHNKMDILNPSLPPTSQQLSAESRTIDRYSPS